MNESVIEMNNLSFSPHEKSLKKLFEMILLKSLEAPCFVIKYPTSYFEL
jgi:hypothetical protein